MSGETRFTNVVAIAGMGRSGSTLLASLLDTIPGFVSVGELQAVWRALERDERCGCGEPLSVCAFWQQVGLEAFGGWSRVDFEDNLRSDRLLARHRSLYRRTPGPEAAARQSAYLESLDRLYAAVRNVATAEFVVDSSKGIPHALLLKRLDAVRVRLVHLVRDSRAVVNSWAREVAQPQYDLNPALRGLPLAQPNSLRASLEWLIINGSFHVHSRRVGDAFFMRYEDLVGSPRDELSRLLGWLGGPQEADALNLLAEGRYVSPTSHSIGGNRIRYQRGEVAIRVDDAWRKEMAPKARRTALLTTWPLLKAYGYPLRTDLRNELK